VTLALVPNVPPLLDYVQKVSPEFARPTHLSEYCELLERAAHEPVRAVCTEPIRMWKTETTLHGVLRMLEIEPTLRIIILCHSHGRAQWMGKRLRELAGRTDVGPTKGWNTIDHWQNDRGGGVVVMSADQSKEGYDCHVLVCDDPIDEHGAQSQEKRDEVDRAIAYYTARCMRKGRPGPVLLVMSRYHLDDPAGRRLQRGWEGHHHPAIIDLGLETERAFAPDVWPLEALKKTRAELAEIDPREKVFWARFQGIPREDTTSGFGEPKRYATFPEWPGHVDYMGVDMSFSKTARADFAAVCVVRWLHGTCYVRMVRRARGELNDLAQLLRDMRLQYGQLPMFSYTSGPERAAILHLSMLGLPIEPMHAGDPKFVRAQPFIDAHNAGTVLWPHEPWVGPLMYRLKKFSGNESDPDDEVDALVSVFNATRVVSSASVPMTLGRRRM
jgi:phage terminase large subunit-like protein